MDTSVAPDKVDQLAITRPRILIVEDDAVAAATLTRELESRGCECVALVLRHEQDFEAAFDVMYPRDQPVRPEHVFQGTVLDVIFKKRGDEKQMEGGRDLYEYWRLSKLDNGHGGTTNILSYLGKLLIASEHDNPRRVFAGISAQFTIKGNSEDLGASLDRFVASL